MRPLLGGLAAVAAFGLSLWLWTATGSDPFIGLGLSGISFLSQLAGYLVYSAGRESVCIHRKAG